MPGRAPGHPATSSDTPRRLAKHDIRSRLCAEADAWVTGRAAGREDRWGHVGRERLGQGIESQCGPAPGLPPWEALTQIRPGQAVSGTRPRHMASCKVDHKVARRPAVHTNHRDLDGGRMAAPVTLEQTFSSTIGTLAFRPTAEPPGRGMGRAAGQRDGERGVGAHG